MGDASRVLIDLEITRDIVYADGSMPTRDRLVELLDMAIDALASAMSAGTDETRSGSGPKGRQRGPKASP